MAAHRQNRAGAGHHVVRSRAHSGAPFVKTCSRSASMAPGSWPVTPPSVNSSEQSIASATAVQPHSSSRSAARVNNTRSRTQTHPRLPCHWSRPPVPTLRRFVASFEAPRTNELVRATQEWGDGVSRCRGWLPTIESAWRETFRDTCAGRSEFELASRGDGGYNLETRGSYGA